MHLTDSKKLPKKLSLIVNKNDILLPGCIKPYRTEDNQNLSLLSKKHKNDSGFSKFIGVTPSLNINTIGTAAIFFKTPTATAIFLSGVCRFKINRIISQEPEIIAEITQIDFHDNCDEILSNSDIAGMIQDLKGAFENVLEQSHSIRLKTLLHKIPVCLLPEVCTSFVELSVQEQLQLLNTLDVTERFRLALTLIKNTTVKKSAIVVPIPSTLSPLSGMNNMNMMSRNSNELKELKKRLIDAKLPDEVNKIVMREYDVLCKQFPFNPEYHMLLSYLNLVADLPWTKLADEILDLPKAKAKLELDHFGLDQVKKRILEYLAVRKLRISNDGSHVGPVLCLVGPPGCGKTSIARSIASTLNRPFVRVSLGGVNDMHDIRGHRRTYVGSMPGRIIHAIKQSGVKNPVVLLDEIDKMSNSIRGNPAAALLEVLDPAQNKEFTDHYLNIPFDLSEILFIGTANATKDFSPALYDRLEIIEVSGYTYIEKVQIAKDYLIPKQLRETGLTQDQIQIPDDTIQLIINNYTREAGVRELERKIGALCRSVAVKITMKDEPNVEELNFPIILDVNTAKDLLGPLFWENKKWSSRLGRPGVAIGLVVTVAGGDTLAVESSFMPGKGKLKLTGSLGEVMQESAHLAWGWVRANANLYGIELDGRRLNTIDVHIHFPAGAVSKDGPSAGVTIATTLMSLFLDRPVLPNVAMTGEITLQGLVLPVGGIRDKIIAAHKDGFTKIIIPQQNEKNLHDIPSNIKDEVTIVLASDMHTIMETVFEDGITLVLPHSIKNKL